MKTIKFFGMIALAIVGAAIASCNIDNIEVDQPQQPEDNSHSITMTTTVSVGNGVDTRALTAEGVKTFAPGETMALIYKNTSGTTVKAESEALTAEDIAVGNQSATFTFTLTSPDKTKDVTYIYPAAMANDDGTPNYEALTVQDGTLATLSSTLDYCTESGAWDADALPTLMLENQLAILACTLKNSDGSSDITDKTTVMTVSDGTHSYTVMRSATAGPVYIAIFPTDASDIEVTTISGASEYTKTLTGKTYETGTGYNVSWRMAQTTVTNATPMTLKAITAGTIVVNEPKSGMQYTLNGGAKTALTETTTIDVAVGDKVAFYGNGTGITAYNGTTISGGTALCIASGNIMSLVDEAGYNTNTTVPANNAFQGLFSENTKLISASELLLPATTLKNLCYYFLFRNCTDLTDAPALLPATTLAQQCYQQMFSGCTSLTTAPVLSATTLGALCCYLMFENCSSLTTAPALQSVTTLASRCYMDMFSGCSSLTTAPELPITTLADRCYEYMFRNCSSLTTAPVLPATILTTRCYMGMFSGCSSLTAAPELPAMTLATICYHVMFADCTSLTAAPELPATTLANQCYQSMFARCTGLTEAPVLPAPTLVTNCYYGMFDGCSNLNSVACWATDLGATNTTQSWLNGVAATGTFTAHNAYVAWTSGVNGIPSGWTRVNPGKPLSSATAEDIGKVVCAAGHLHDAKTAVPAPCTAIGILGKVTGTGHGLILALHNANSQSWYTINGWTSVATYAGTTLKVVPTAAMGANLKSCTTLGPTPVSNWAVAQKADYAAIFQNLGSTKNDQGYCFDANVNAYITTGVGGTAISDNCLSATKNTETASDTGWICNSSMGWRGYLASASGNIRPVLGF